ncbi:hypothetical protein PUN28_007696 [Cardiocondyla obscurior]|uniref:Uncharacterized protein n=1 Tax=Cardiocondyla obscurior TaxID=286306 RepID=A0AAW2FZQ6_9HYME
MIPPQIGLGDENPAGCYSAAPALDGPLCAVASLSSSRKVPTETEDTIDPLPVRARPEKSDVATPPVQALRFTGPLRLFSGTPSPRRRDQKLATRKTRSKKPVLPRIITAIGMYTT